MKRLILLTAILLLPVLVKAGSKPNVAISANQVGPPDLTNLQGRLTDTAGNNVPNGNYTMIFSLYDRATAGSQLWAETLSVPVSGGLFSVILGEVHGLDPGFLRGLDPGFSPHLQITVNGQVLSTRMKIVSTPYAEHATRVTGDIQTGPGEILFVGGGVQPDLPGIIFQDTTTGDTTAQYGPGGAVFNPVNPPELPIMASYGPGGAVFVTTGGAPDLPIAAFHPINGIMFADTVTGDTTVKLDPNGLVLGLDPSFVKIESQGLQLNGASGKIELTDDGIVMTDVNGDTGMLLTNYKLEHEDTAGATTILFGDGLHGAVPQLGRSMIVSTMLGLKYSKAGKDMAVYAPDKFLLADTTSGDTTVKLDANGLVLGVDPGLVKIESQGKMYLGKTAGTSQAIQIGDYYKDNAIVAWGRVTGAGGLTNEFGVTSVTRNSTGNYTITIDDTASLAGNFIPMAVAELDTPPTTASTARIVYVNQLGTTPFNKFDIYITNGSFAATDNDFMFIVTAR